MALGPGKVKRQSRDASARRREPLRPDPLKLLAWYDAHRRILPWRALPGETPDPYRVWLSEVMLQQTTVAAVGPYYQKFLKNWPRLRDLVKAPLEDVLRAWAGLGYYRRARSLHACAQQLMAKNKGVIPSAEAELLKLPGFGPYTAAAVRAIAFNERANVVDGNVERVMARIFAVRIPLAKSKAKLRALAETLLPASRFGDYAQALMDLGATLCTPRNPKCGLCPWSKECQAQALGLTEILPLRTKSVKRPLRRAIAFILFNKKGEILLRRRPMDGLLGGMMEIPSTPWQESAMPGLGKALPLAPATADWRLLPGNVRHVFTHFELELRVAVATTKREGRGHFVDPLDLRREAMPSVMHKIVRHALKSI